MKTLTVGPLDVNCYILWDDETRRAVIIDPGGDADEIIKASRDLGIKPLYIVNTHGHHDHVGGDARVREALGGKLAVHRLDAPLLSEAHEHAALYGVKSGAQPEPDLLLEGGEEIVAGPLRLKVLHTPGHTEGGICLYDEMTGVLFTGDTLFAGSIGRTDFKGGSFDAIMKSIRERIMTLPDHVMVLPGHGPGSTIGRERRLNPFIAKAEG
jgi:glyoxylase-like metal-dependent hydrolase (beta-lactamase superfamily II)